MLGNLNKFIDNHLYDEFGRIKSFIVTCNYWLRRYRKKIWIVGDGRSGTTWLSEMINFNHQFRDMFEPFHPYLVNQAKKFTPFLYLSPGENKPEFAEFADNVFSGDFRDHRVNVMNSKLFYKGLIIKDIFAHLFFTWVMERYKDLESILIIRNPMAVALSKLKCKGYFWFDSPGELFKDTALRAKHLFPFEDLLTDKSFDFIERQVLIWAAIHYVLIREADLSRIKIVYYEKLAQNPESEMEKIFRFLNMNPDGIIKTEAFKSKINKPSRVSRKDSSIIRGIPEIKSWETEIPTESIARCKTILKSFMLDDIYNNNGMPYTELSEKKKELVSTRI